MLNEHIMKTKAPPVGSIVQVKTVPPQLAKIIDVEDDYYIIYIIGQTQYFKTSSNNLMLLPRLGHKKLAAFKWLVTN